MKIFIVSLPRTGTTSICEYFIHNGFKVAHTAFTQEAFHQAQVVADTPVFSDYKELDALFPDAKFIYNDRPIEQWLPSIQALLLRMQTRMLDPKNGFHHVLKRSYQSVFEFNADGFDCSDASLSLCYQQHKEALFQYFKSRDDFFVYQLGSNKSLQHLHRFVGIEATANAVMPIVNQDGRINAWKQVKSINKVDSHAFGAERRRYFNYFKE